MATKMNAGFKAMMDKKKGGADSLAKHASMPASKAHAGLKSGGVTRADGVVTKGHTKGKQIAMCSGGMAKKK